MYFYKVNERMIETEEGIVREPDINVDFCAIDCEEFFIVKVWEKLDLEELTLDEVKELARQYQPELTDEEIEGWAKF